MEPALRRSLLMAGLSPVDRHPSASESSSTVTVGFWLFCIHTAPCRGV